MNPVLGGLGVGLLLGSEPDVAVPLGPRVDGGFFAEQPAKANAKTTHAASPGASFRRTILHSLSLRATARDHVDRLRKGAALLVCKRGPRANTRFLAKRRYQTPVNVAGWSRDWT